MTAVIKENQTGAALLLARIAARLRRALDAYAAARLRRVQWDIALHLPSRENEPDQSIVLQSFRAAEKARLKKEMECVP